MKNRQVFLGAITTLAVAAVVPGLAHAAASTEAAVPLSKSLEITVDAYGRPLIAGQEIGQHVEKAHRKPLRVAGNYRCSNTSCKSQPTGQAQPNGQAADVASV